jgi:hypothetical protein
MPMQYEEAVKFADDTLANDGATVSLRGQLVPLSGYFVSEQGGTDVRADTFNGQDVLNFVISHIHELSRLGAYLGSWIEDGQVFLDVSYHYYSRDDAMRSARDNAQLAIWDIANAMAIRTEVAA